MGSLANERRRAIVAGEGAGDGIALKWTMLPLVPNMGQKGRTYTPQELAVERCGNWRQGEAGTGGRARQNGAKRGGNWRQVCRQRGE
ncbi:MAG: hypothetical protein J5884_03810 [Paludibacteraceae bacterium]|nr:hypothetical protein [Paludibacteraceae bacterium]